MTMTLYAREGSFAAQKVIVAAQYAGATLNVDTSKTEKDLKGKGAADRLPLLETDKGCLFTSNAIMKFVANGKSELCGKDAFEAAQIESWIDFSANEVEVPAVMATYPIIGWAENSPEVQAKALKDLKAAMQVLEDHLKLETFLVGRSITLADIAVACALVLPMKLVLDTKGRKSYACVTRWFTTCVNQPNFLKVVGPVTLAKKVTKSLAPAVAGAAAAAPAKKAEAPKEAKPEPVDPIAALGKLPKSSLVMDSWKRQYSNAPNGDCYKAMPWFWENLDKEGYSIFFSHYKYNEECKILFQTSNLCGGFCQRLDQVRKHLFGCMQILGTEDSQEVEGCWLIRGQSAEPILFCNPDAEYHEWIKVDVNTIDEATKQKIADFWCAEEKIGDKMIQDCKVFK